MFKRLNKMTALLVAMAAISSLIPATGVNAAEIKRIASEDGKIYSAFAYKDGKFYVDGEIRGKDEGTYYLENNKFTELENIDTQDEYTIYGNKYLDFEYEDYYLDLSNGKETDAELEEDDRDDAATGLRKKVKDDNDGRYTDDAKNVKTLVEISGKEFANPYYVTQYEASSKNNSTPSKFNVFTDAKGVYVDADHLIGKIKVVLADNSKATVENTADSDNGVSAKVRADESYGEYGAVAQDDSYVYRIADITLTSNKEIKKIDDVDVTDGSAFTSNKTITEGETPTTTYTVEFKVIQKIAKAQDGDTSGAKTPKSAASYILSDDGGAKKTLLGTGEDAKFTVVNGKLVNYTVDSDSVEAQTITLKKTKNYFYTDVSGSASVDLDKAENGWDLDVDGNLWAVSGGYIRQFNNDDDWDKVYKVDGSFESLSVYNKDNMIAWNEGDEVYSIIGSKEEEKETEAETPAVVKGWVQATDGTWTYVKEDGNKATGWINLSGVWYYLKADGIMATGWVNDNGTWYYLNGSGAMLSNTTVDGYVLGASGAWIK